MRRYDSVIVFTLAAIVAPVSLTGAASTRPLLTTREVTLASQASTKLSFSGRTIPQPTIEVLERLVAEGNTVVIRNSVFEGPLSLGAAFDGEQHESRLDPEILDHMGVTDLSERPPILFVRGRFEITESTIPSIHVPAPGVDPNTVTVFTDGFMLGTNSIEGVSFSRAVFLGTLGFLRNTGRSKRFEQCWFSTPVFLDTELTESFVSFDRSVFAAGGFLTGQFKSRAFFRNTKFLDPRAQASGQLTVFIGLSFLALFEKGADFSGAEFHGAVTFAKARFGEEVDFGGAEILNSISFRDAIFEEGADFRSWELSQESSLDMTGLRTQGRLRGLSWSGTSNALRRYYADVHNDTQFAMLSMQYRDIGVLDERSAIGQAAAARLRREHIVALKLIEEHSRASALGDDSASAHREHKRLERLDRSRHLQLWDCGLDLLSGYGTEPDRLFWTGFSVVLVFALAYAGFDVRFGGGHDESAQPVKRKPLIILPNEIQDEPTTSEPGLISRMIAGLLLSMMVFFAVTTILAFQLGLRSERAVNLLYPSIRLVRLRKGRKFPSFGWSRSPVRIVPVLNVLEAAIGVVILVVSGYTLSGAWSD
jgi:hypothetical protein